VETAQLAKKDTMDLSAKNAIGSTELVTTVFKEMALVFAMLVGQDLRALNAWTITVHFSHQMEFLCTRYKI